MRLFPAIFFILTVASCGVGDDNWSVQWDKHNAAFQDIANLLKAGKLERVYGRGGYAIPDSFRFGSVCGQIVFRETDFTYDSTFSILFRLGFDKDIHTRSYQTIVYTNNERRIKEYESDAGNVTRIKENWYSINRP